MADELKKEKGSLSVHTENLLPIIKKWLYSEHDIFLRELISNAFDAIQKLRRLKMTGEFEGEEPEYRIDVEVDKEKKTITIKDNGLGLDADEVKKYINQIAFSGAKEFVQKYEKVNDQQNLIGHFGLGFYSSFMVANEVEIFSLSYKKGAEAIHWKSDGTTEYELEAADKKEVGTHIILHLMEEEEKHLDKTAIQDLVKKYSNFLPVPIYVDGEKTNSGEPLWSKSPNELKEEDYLNFYKALYPGEMDPLFWIHLKTDYPFELKGVVYFPRLMHELDATKGNIKLFVNNVFVGDKLKEVTPEFLSPLMGALDSADIPLNVSRSQLQGDIRIRKISSHIVKKAAEKLAEIYTKDKEKYQEIWQNINTFIKFGCIQDNDFYEKVKKALIFKNTKDEYVTLEDYIEKNKEKNKNKDSKTLILYLNEDQDLSSFEAMIKENDLEAVFMNSSIDSHLMDFLERKNEEIKFARIDSDLNDILFESVKTLDTEKENEIKAIVAKYLPEKTIQVDVKELKNEEIPAMLTNAEQMRRIQEMTAMMTGGKKASLGLMGSTLVLNGRSALIQKLPLVESTDAKKAEELVGHIFDLACLSSGKLEGERLANFVKRSYKILEND